MGRALHSPVVGRGNQAYRKSFPYALEWKCPSSARFAVTLLTWILVFGQPGSVSALTGTCIIALLQAARSG
jgi:hypothetical protein